MTPTTARLIAYWTDSNREKRLFFCQIEALETAIYITEVAKPSRLAYDDGFADADGEPQESAPVGSSTVDLLATDSGTQMVMTATYPTPEDLQKVLDMGMEEGITQAVNQVDALLAA